MLLAGSVYSVTLSSVLSLYKKKYFLWFSSSSESEGSKQLMSSGICFDSIKLMSDGTIGCNWVLSGNLSSVKTGFDCLIAVTIDNRFWLLEKS